MKQKFISIFILILLSSCSSIAPAPNAATLTASINTPLPTELPTSAPTQTPVPTQNPALEYQKIEEEYIATLSSEQKALYVQYNSKDRTSEGLARRFLDGDMSTYLAYVDMNKDSKDFGEVTFIWNPEQQKPNPTLLIGDDVLFINTSSASKMAFTKAEAEDTLVKYFKYVRANTIALSHRVNLPNTLDEALANPRAIEYLANGGQVNLRSVRSENHSLHKYNVPAQTISLSGSTAIVFKTVPEPDSNMFFLSFDKDKYYGWSINQASGQPLTINYYSNGGDATPGPDPMMLLSNRIYRSFNNIFLEYRMITLQIPSQIKLYLITTIGAPSHS